MLPQRRRKTFHFTQLNLPPAELRLRHEPDGRCYVYDSDRGKWLVLTDEEWVRQNFTAYLTSALGYPASVVGNEVALTLNNTRRRADTVVFGRNGRPAMVVEYKAPTVKITSEVFDQIVRYNIVMQARVIAVSNGLVHYCCEVDCATGAYNFLPQIPSYHQLISLTTNG